MLPLPARLQLAIVDALREWADGSDDLEVIGNEVLSVADLRRPTDPELADALDALAADLMDAAIADGSDCGDAP